MTILYNAKSINRDVSNAVKSAVTGAEIQRVIRVKAVFHAFAQSKREGMFAPLNKLFEGLDGNKYQSELKRLARLVNEHFECKVITFSKKDGFKFGKGFKEIDVTSIDIDLIEAIDGTAPEPKAPKADYDKVLAFVKAMESETNDYDITPLIQRELTALKQVATKQKENAESAAA